MKKVFTSKPLYIVLLVLSALALVASILTRILIPTNMGGMNIPNMPNGQDFQNFQPGGMPSFGDGEGFDFGDMPSFDGKGSFSPGNMPSFGGDRDGQSFDPSKIPQNSPLTDGNGRGGKAGFLQSFRKAWLPVAIISFVIMVFSIVMLAIISRRKKKAIQAQEAARYEGLSQDEILRLQIQEENAQTQKSKTKRKTKNIILSCILVLLIVFVTVVGKMMTAGTGISINSQVDEEVLSANVETASLSTVLKGVGSVAFDDAQEVKLPGTVKVARWLVKNGDQVKEGDAVAEIDTDSLASAIADLQTLIGELDADLEKARDDTISSEITAVASGRVISIYASEEDEIADLMDDYGALLVLSLDGTLAVELPQDSKISVGAEVTFTTSEGTEFSGKIASKNQTEMIAIVSDEETVVGDKVMVKDLEGRNLGSGTLYIHSEQRVTGFTGIVNEVQVSEGDIVEAGDVLLNLEDAEYSMVYDQLLGKRNVLDENMRALILAYASGYVYAGMDGVISGIDESTANMTAGGSLKGVALSSANITKSLSLIVIQKNEPEINDEIQEEEPEEGEPEEEEPEEEEPEEGEPEEGEPEEEEPEEEEPEGGEPEEGEPEGGEPEGGEPEEGEQEEERITALKNMLIEKINLLDYDSLMKVFELLQKLENGEGNPSEEAPSDDRPSGDRPFDNGNAGNDSGNIPGFDNREQGNMPNTPSGMDFSNWGGMSGNFNGLNNATDPAASSEEEEEDVDVSKYELSQTSFCNITPDREINIDIQVDEKDIALVQPGMEVKVSLDAYPGRSFTGTVTEIDKEGTNDGGSTKFTVTIVMTSEVKILSGMNASVIIPKENRENVLTIPLNAIVEEGSRIFVYTGYDEENDELLNPVEVVLGISDGENAEILSGLALGDVYYYRYAGSITYNFLNRLSK